MRHCDSKELLKSRHIRITERKLAILQSILSSSTPVNASELHGRVSSALRMDLATVYRALSSFREKGLIREITDDTGTLYYEIACLHNPVHPHFKCLKCLKISCLEFLDHDSTSSMTRLARDCEIIDISITLSGICRECRMEISE
jgi:Fur family transcriptional regulator, ferric uptake regulator